MKLMTIDQYPTVDDASAWQAIDFSDMQELTFQFESRHLAVLGRALEAVRDKSTSDITRGDFDLDEIAPDITQLRDEVLHGRGIVILKGLPVDQYCVADMERMFFGLGAHFGNAVSQSRMGDRIGHVVDASRMPHERGYRSARELSFHTDSNDVVMMLCLRAAVSGGMNRFVSSMAVYNELVKTAPHLLQSLFDGFPYHWRGEEPAGEPPITDYRVPVLSRRDGVISCVFLREFISMACDGLKAPLSAVQHEALERFQQIADDADNVLNVRLAAGEAFIINNFTVMHSRTAFEDSPESGLGRHLLRLWLACPGARPLVEEVQRYYGTDGIESREGEGTIYVPGTGS